MGDPAPEPCEYCGSYYSDFDTWTHWSDGEREWTFCQSCVHEVLGPEYVYKPPTWEEQKARWDEINKYRESKGLFRI